MKTRLAIVAVALSLSGCGDGKPSASEIERQVSERALQFTSDFMRVENFEKLNGFDKGEGLYTATVRYDLVTTKSSRQAVAEAKERNGNNEKRFYEDEKVGALLAVGLGWGEFPAGMRRTNTATVKFVRSEKGWVLE